MTVLVPTDRINVLLSHQLQHLVMEQLVLVVIRSWGEGNYFLV